MTLPGNRKLVPAPGYQRIYSDAQEAGIELTDGQSLPVSAADEARLRYNVLTNRLEVSLSGGAWVPVLAADVPSYVSDISPGILSAYPAGELRIPASDGATPGLIWRTYAELGVGGIISIATRAALSALPSAGLAEGACVYVYETGYADIYVLDRVGAHTVDGVVVLNASDGGYWVSRMSGRWDDVFGNVSQGVAVGALTYENYRDTAFKMNFFRHDQNDELSFAYQLPHKWRYTTSVAPHLHLVPMVDPPAQRKVNFRGYYAWGVISTEIPLLVGWTTFDVDININVGDAFKHIYAPLVTAIPPGTARESTIFNLYVRRYTGAGTTDTYNTNKVGGTVQANLGILSTDLHYQTHWMGTEEASPSP